MESKIYKLILNGVSFIRRLDIPFCNIRELGLTGLKNLKSVEVSHGNVTGTDHLITLVCNNNYMSSVKKVTGLNASLQNSIEKDFMFSP